VANLSWKAFYNTALHAEPKHFLVDYNTAVDSIVQRIRFLGDDYSRASSLERHALNIALSDLIVIRAAFVAARQITFWR